MSDTSGETINPVPFLEICFTKPDEVVRSRRQPFMLSSRTFSIGLIQPCSIAGDLPVPG